MYFKSLEIHGFKSFPDKISLDFDTRMTAVVGPNGSGKSNISDAIRWVMGEQGAKSLRGDKMEDIIFHGTVTRKQMGFAQITLNIDNSDGYLKIDSEEVGITRKLYRDGDSEFLINGKKSRLKDIHELLMDTGLGKDGYSIIGQGKVAEIINAKGSRRREIFEEAAGVSKFRYKKEEAERSLALAQENILRQKDILAELEVRVPVLKTQSEKAHTFIKLSEEVKDLEISVWVSVLDGQKEKLLEIEDNILINRNEYDVLDAKLSEIEEEIAENYEKVQLCQSDIERIRSDSLQSREEISEHKSEIAVLENDIMHCREKIDRLNEQIDNSHITAKDYDNEIQDINNSIDKKRQEISDTENDITDIGKQFEQILTDSEEQDKQYKELDELSGRLYFNKTESTIAINHAQENIKTLQEQLEKVNTAIAERKDTLERYRIESEEMKQAAAKVKDAKSDAENRLNGYSKLLDTKKAKLNDAKAGYDTTSSAHNQKQNRLKILSDVEKNMEGYFQSVKEVIRWSKNGNITGIHGTVADIINVDEKYAIAIEIALGTAIQNIVVDNENTAKRCILFLKENKAGRATFLPMTSIRGNILEKKGFDSEYGYEGIACELISYDGKYDNIVKSLLGRTVIVEDIDVATVISKKYGNRFRIVTLDGQVINAGGSYTGGSVQKSGGIITRKHEIDVLSAEIKDIDGQLAEKAAGIKMLQAEVNKFNIDVEGMRELLQEISRDEIRFESEIKRLDSLTEQSGQIEKNDRLESERINNEIKKQDNIITENSAKLAGIEQEIESISGKLAQSGDKAQEINAKRTELSEKLSALKIKQSSDEKDIEVYKKQLEQIEINKKNLYNNNEDLKSQIEMTGNLIQEKEKKISDTKSLIEKINTDISEHDTDIQRINEKRNSHELSITNLRKSSKETLESREKHAREISRHEERKISIQKEYDNVISELWEKYQLAKSEADALAKPVENIIAANRQLSDLRKKITALGAINVAAIEEYKEVSERYEFLNKQLTDIENSKKELERLIGELTEQIKTQFIEHFNLINNSFSEIFVEMFGGGKAELVLSNPEDVLNSGVEIFAAPPGKVIKSLISLSGGEQTMVAITIYFAILRHRPTPFCMLDEVDSALDEVNIAKYISYLKNYSNKTQFILVTHRRGTMEGCDVLYGVTMQEKGVSKLLRLQLGDEIELTG